MGVPSQQKNNPTSHAWPMDLQLSNPALAYATEKKYMID